MTSGSQLIQFTPEHKELFTKVLKRKHQEYCELLSNPEKLGKGLNFATYCYTQSIAKYRTFLCDLQEGLIRIIRLLGSGCDHGN
jgi:hypothetical protein